VWEAKRFDIMSLTCIATSRPPATLRDYKPGTWVLYQRVIDQSKADIFIKPGIIQKANVFSSLTNFPYLFRKSQKKLSHCHFCVIF